MNRISKLKSIGVIIFAILLGCILNGQENRTFDGTSNNFANPFWGSANQEMPRTAPADYSDGISQPNGINRPNPREISNHLFDQNGDVFDIVGLSDYVWVFGQFLDHDFTLVENDPGQSATINVPVGDPIFDPDSEGTSIIPMNRSHEMSGTGTSPFNPREHVNLISSYIDGSGVYGSDITRANWLRTFNNGKLKTSEGNLLPFNSIDGQFDSQEDLTSPFMADDLGTNDKLQVAGDVRANENILLASMHTLFVREHNRLCDELLALNPTWTDEELYQAARRKVGAYIQAITYYEWLPTMGVELEEYEAYSPFVNASITNEFSASAFRWGHTLLSSTLKRLDASGNELSGGHVNLKEAFFNPQMLLEMGELEPLYRGMASQLQQKMDGKIVDDVRNFLFEVDGLGGLDLAAININRGRERGIADFNTYREALGMSPISAFNQIHSNVEISSGLEAMYGNVNNIDSWVGLLIEESLEESMFGPTVHEIMKQQFTALRDGDRFYFQNDPEFSNEEVQEIKNTRLSDIIIRNSEISEIQENVFMAKDFAGEEVRVQSIELDMAIFPNPAIDQTVIKLYSNNGGNAQITLYKISGEFILSREQVLTPGINVIPFSLPAEMTQGAYQINVVSGQASNSKILLKN